MTPDTYIIGSGQTKLGRLSETFEDLTLPAAQEAIDSADVDTAGPRLRLA